MVEENIFHKHLDVCKQCREQPFNLCKIGAGLIVEAALGDSDCSMCEDKTLKGNPMSLLKRRFIVCKTCGNKRCPRASWHEQECTSSNEPGQKGSFYGPEEFWPKRSSS